MNRHRLRFTMEWVSEFTSSEREWLDCLTAARSGCPEAVGGLLERFRPVLLGVAAGALDSDLRSKADAADIVQDSLLEALCTFGSFRGCRSEELLGWLKQILLHNLANFRRHYRDAEMRDVHREVGLPTTSPSAVSGDALESDSVCTVEKVARREEETRLSQALDRLRPVYRAVITWRQWENQSFEQIGQKLGRTSEAARQIWWRAIEQLRVELAPRT
jgi:RNA polymerase sigma-70 factor (ECF subfamily)